MRWAAVQSAMANPLRSAKKERSRIRRSMLKNEFATYFDIFWKRCGVGNGGEMMLKFLFWRFARKIFLMSSLTDCTTDILVGLTHL